jgi:hypothetical protein
MAGYIRKTVLSTAQVLERADDLLPGLLGLTKAANSGHGVTYTGKEGTVKLAVHPHSLFNEVTATTDQLRTSRMDYEIQRFLNQLPYEPGDVGGPGSGDWT